MNKENEVRNTVLKLKSNPMISEIEVCNSDECVGINEDQLYVTITHHVDLMNNPIYKELCDLAVIESCDTIEDENLETQLVI